MRIEINRGSKTPVYKQIVRQIKNQILSGELSAGYVFPPERRLAESIGVNRTTILNAYRELKDEHLIASRVGSGTVVLPLPAGDNPRHKVFAEEPMWEYFFSQNSLHFESAEINNLLSYINRKDNISFASGAAHTDARTERILKDILRMIIDDSDFSELFAAPAEGYASLRESMSKFMEKRGCLCGQNDIMILSGSQQGIDITARVLIEPGDVVVIEEPTYMPALQIFRSMGARIISVPVDNDGMDTDMLERVLRRYHPKLVYTMPTCHNPTGVSMSLVRRRHLTELANRFKVLVLEDDAYGELSYADELLPSLKSMDNSGYVIYLSSFSNFFYPGLRIGWIATHSRLVKRFASARQSADLYTNSLSQKIIEHFISGSYYEEQLRYIRAIYKAKHDRMIAALEHYAPPGMTWTAPGGGCYVWCRLPDGVLSMQLLAKCSEQNVSFLPGSIFFSSIQEHEYLRLNFTCVNEKDIDKGIKVICSLTAELQRQKRKVRPNNEMLAIM